MVSSWVSPDELGKSSNSPYAYEACQTASYILWGLSGRKFHGTITTTETYEFPARSVNEFDPRFTIYPHLVNGDVVNGCTCNSCPGHTHLRLRGRPVRSVSEVRIGGVIVDPETYWLENRAVLGIAGCPDLCNVQVTYTYGAQPPMAGRRAARYLAQQFVLSWEGSEDCELPERVTSVSRQGVSYQLLDNGTFIDDMRTGIYSVDLFLKTVNPDNARKPARVFSPDLPSAKRVARRLPVQSEIGPNDLQIVPGKPYTWSIILNDTLIDGVNYVPQGQISTWNGASVFEMNADHFSFVAGMLLCSFTAADTKRAGIIGQGVWDLYAVSVADPNTFIHLLSSNIWLVSETMTQEVNLLQVGVWAGYGPPPSVIPGSHDGEQYIDLSTWDVYTLSGSGA